MPPHGPRRFGAADDPLLDGQDLFHELLKEVDPLPDHGRVLLRADPPPPVPVQRLLDDQQVLADSLSDAADPDLELEEGDRLAYLRSGVARDVLRKLRRGHWAIQKTLDLHGLRSEEARPALAQFLAQGVKRGLRCILVVHGKGLSSPNQLPVLKGRVARWLAQRGEVLAFCEPRAADGGSGATVVLLRSKSTAPAPNEAEDW